MNYKSGFSTVRSSQPGSSPSFSFVNEAKTGLFPGFVSCNAATLSLPSPISQNPHLYRSLDPAPKGAENLFRHNWVFGLFPPLLQSVRRCREQGVSWNTPQQFTGWARMTKSHPSGEFPSSATGCVGCHLGLEGRMGLLSVELLGAAVFRVLVKPVVFSGGLC